MKTRRAPSHCPACGEEVPPQAKSCPECGACEKSGWSSDAAADGLDLPDDEFDYDRFVGEEFGSGARPAGQQWLWWAVALALLVTFAVLTFMR